MNMNRNMNKRNFLVGASLLGAAGLAGAASARAADPTNSTLASAAEASGARTGSVFNVMDFGAKGDGKTPDSDAIQKAMDAAGAVSGTAYFPAGRYLCHDLKVHPHTTLLAEAQWGYRGGNGALLVLDSDAADCVLNITGAFGAHLRGLGLEGRKAATKAIHGVFLNNAQRFSPQENCIVIDDCKIEQFSGHGVYLLRIWLFIIRHSIFMANTGSGVQINGYDGFAMDNQFAGNGGHGFGCEGEGDTVMFTANRVEWNLGYGLYLCGGDTWNVTGNCFDRNWGAGLCALKMRNITATGNAFRRCGNDSSLLAEGERSSQVRLEECRGLSFVGNTCAAGQGDGGRGSFSPKYGFFLRKLSYSVIASNVLFDGYLQDMKVDLGEHGADYVFANNVGCARAA